MNKFGGLITALVTLALVACGGGSDSNFAGSGSSSSSGGAGTGAVASIRVTSSVNTVPADGSPGPTITALALDSHNNALSGIAVTFSATAGGVLVNETTTTNSSGVATATLESNNAAIGSTISVNAAAGSASGQVTVTVASTQASITLLASSPQLPSDGSKPVTLTAIVRNASNQLVTGAAVNFSATSGGITPVQTTAGSTATPSVPAGTTDINGSAQATLSPAGDPSSRVITVTATTGTATTTMVINVVGSTLTVSGPQSLIMGAAGTFTVSLLDSGQNAIPNATVKVASAQGNTLSTQSVVTDSSGHATFQVTATKPGSDTITVTSLGLTGTATVLVSSESFNITAPTATALVPLNTAQTVTVQWTNNGAPVANNTVVTFSTTRGLFGGASVTTTALTAAGVATVSISSATAGPVTITATGTDPSNSTAVSTVVSFNFVAVVPASINVQASPATVATQAKSTITAIVRDSSNNLVAGATVAFQLTDVTGGSLSVGSAVTNTNGQAQTVYTAGTTASSRNGVTITATVQGTSVPAATVSLTVGGQTLFLSLGTGATISENAQFTQFSDPFVVQALDSGGNPVAGVTITMTVHSLPPTGGTYSNVGGNFIAPQTYSAYAKGQWIVAGTQWVQANGKGAVSPNGTMPLTTWCLNEDSAGTGIFSSAEDYNGNGRLDPADVAVVSPGTIVTDSTGTGNLAVTYPEDHAGWVQVILTATATVSGTQTTTSSIFVLPMLAKYVNNITTAVPGQYSPYGTALSCSNPN